MVTIIILNIFLLSALGIYIPPIPKKRYLGKRKYESWLSEPDAALEDMKIWDEFSKIPATPITFN